VAIRCYIFLLCRCLPSGMDVSGWMEGRRDAYNEQPILPTFRRTYLDGIFYPPCTPACLMPASLVTIWTGHFQREKCLKMFLGVPGWSYHPFGCCSFVTGGQHLERLTNNMALQCYNVSNEACYFLSFILTKSKCAMLL